MTENGKTNLNCLYRLDAAFYCATPANQIRQYYRNGHVESCNEKFSNLIKCWRAKLMSTDSAMAYLKDTPIDPEKEPHSASIWEIKKKPGWE